VILKTIYLFIVTNNSIANTFSEYPCWWISIKADFLEWNLTCELQERHRGASQHIRRGTLRRQSPDKWRPNHRYLRDGKLDWCQLALQREDWSGKIRFLFDLSSDIWLFNNSHQNLYLRMLIEKPTQIKESIRLKSFVKKVHITLFN